MNPFFTAINYPVGKGHVMLMVLPDYQAAHVGPNFLTYMGMAEYGITSRWTVGFMGEGEKIAGLPATYGGLRFSTRYQLARSNRLWHLTLDGEFEDLNQAALYKMEVSGMGSGDLTEPLPMARVSPAHTFEQRLILYRDWGRWNATLNVISETGLDAPHDNDIGYAWGVFHQPAWTGSGMLMHMTDGAVMSAPAPAPVSLTRLGYGVEMIGALGNTHHFGFDWQAQQQYGGPVVTYAIAEHWSLHLEPAFGLSRTGDPFVMRIGVGYMAHTGGNPR